MTTIYIYRVRCLTDNVDEQWILKSNDPVPTTCPTNTAHEIDHTQTTITNIIEENQVVVKEESTPTGGHFGSRTMHIDAAKGTVTQTSMHWPFPVSALTLEFITTSQHTGDCVSLGIGKDTIIGVLMAPITPATPWTQQNYTVGDAVTFSTQKFGLRTYTCINNTTNNDIPTNTYFWKHGFKLHVSPTVVQHSAIGFWLKLFNGINITEYTQVIHLNKETCTVFIEKSPSIAFSPAPIPTYIMQCVYLIKDYELGEPWKQDIGKSKIGGSYILADTLVTVEYLNHSNDEDKVLIGSVEYLY